MKLTQVHIYTDFATAGTVQVLEIFAFSNASDRSVVISADGSSIPFIKLPENAQSVGYEAGQDSAPFTAADKGLAAVPSDTPYSIIAFFNLPYDNKLDLSQPFTIDAPAIILLTPDGMKVSSKQFSDKGVQVIQTNTYHEFAGDRSESRPNAELLRQREAPGEFGNGAGCAPDHNDRRGRPGHLVDRGGHVPLFP